MAALNNNINLDCKIEESDLIGEGAYGKVNFFVFYLSQIIFVIYSRFIRSI